MILMRILLLVNSFYFFAPWLAGWLVPAGGMVFRNQAWFSALDDRQEWKRFPVEAQPYI